MFAHSFQDSHLGFICLRIDFAHCFGFFLNPHTFAKTLFSFQGTTRSACQRRFSILSDALDCVKNFFLTPAAASLNNSAFYITKLSRFCQLVFYIFFALLQYCLVLSSTDNTLLFLF